MNSTSLIIPISKSTADEIAAAKARFAPHKMCNDQWTANTISRANDLGNIDPSSVVLFEGRRDEELDEQRRLNIAEMPYQTVLTERSIEILSGIAACCLSRNELAHLEELKACLERARR